MTELTTQGGLLLTSSCPLGVGAAGNKTRSSKYPIAQYLTLRRLI